MSKGASRRFRGNHQKRRREARRPGFYVADPIERVAREGLPVAWVSDGSEVWEVPAPAAPPPRLRGGAGAPP